MVEKTGFISELKAKDNVEDIFLIKYIAAMEARDGRSYLNVILMDSSGDVEARKWHGAEDALSKVAKGDFVFVKGKVNLYQGRLQLIVSDIYGVDASEVDKEKFIAKAEVPSDVMYEELLSIVEKLDDVYIKDLLKAVLFDPEISRRMKEWPAGKTIHHAYKGGLLEHLLSCTKLGLSISTHYNANENFVVAGAVLHDIGKLYELSEGPLAEYTEEGKLVGHLVKGVEIMERFMTRLAYSFPRDTKMHLKHILLSHHGESEYGSPKPPQTTEALIVHLIDLMDSKVNSFDTAKKACKLPGKWTGFVKHLDRLVYKCELPCYTDYVAEEDVESKKSDTEKSSKKNDKKRKYVDKELTHNMSSKLKDFKPKE